MFNSELFKLAREKIKYTTSRHNIIASNIANANTYGAKSKDLAPFNAHFGKQNNVTMKKTSKRHIDPPIYASSYKVIYSAEGTENKLSNNNINLDSESVKLNTNKLEYKSALSMYAKMTHIFSETLDQR